MMTWNEHGTLRPDSAIAQPHTGLLWVYLNGKCNFSCEYCLDGRNHLEGRPATNPAFVRNLATLQKRLQFSLIFTGGEPLIEIGLLKELYSTFSAVPKAIQTNGSLFKNAEVLMPHFQGHDWISISIHDETYLTKERIEQVEKVAALAREHPVNVFFQLMCSIDNIEPMLRRAEHFRRLGHRVALRRLFTYDAIFFRKYRAEIERVSTESWAAPAFFGDPWEAVQPFKAAIVYLDGDIRMVCRDEVSIGNLYGDYCLSKINALQNRMCDEICHCCSCIWVGEKWGFA